MARVVELPVHTHPLLPFTRFSFGTCRGCRSFSMIYGGYRCNEIECDNMFHKECAESSPEINHSSHPDHPLKLTFLDFQSSSCSICQDSLEAGYSCSECDFKLDLVCATKPPPLVILEKSNVHKHPLQFSHGTKLDDTSSYRECKVCTTRVFGGQKIYECRQCEFIYHVECVKLFPEAYHTSHPEHPLKYLKCDEAPDYANKGCLLCGVVFKQQLHHCEVCNVSICYMCMIDPPPLAVVSPTTHEHQLHLIPRRMIFTCNACGTQGDRSPYFCLECNFMIHRDCIDLPRVININRHDHRISYTRRLGHGEWKCGVCRRKVDEFYGGYSCSKCSGYVVHSGCATRSDVWDKIELEGTPEEPEEIAPFVVIDDNTIKHFSHDHHLHINKDGPSLHENTLCKACAFQICSESSYSCGQCDFILHEKCANLPRRKRHACQVHPLSLKTDYEEASTCILCHNLFTGFRYQYDYLNIIDVRCGSVLEPFVHKSHPHPLYYARNKSTCSECGKEGYWNLSCDECDFSLDFKCALLPPTVMKHRYDDHPLFLSCGESCVDGEYWCEACETKVNPKKWFYTCNDCGVILHIACIFGEFSYLLPGSAISLDEQVVIPNTSICRLLCFVCNSRCMLPSFLKYSEGGVDVQVCSYKCLDKYVFH
ncbi:unnamed protein product [Microthlaspi erraticum]|uniref:Phorbol-ester/DAG-type domain-containing protein n=1 Tax=Microthlaspi erraticum TaxID=1685480 RepID=A0A6D2J5S5_9BRAS|nr:unnamed protein product [Microthlaspi erraticum]